MSRNNSGHLSLDAPWELLPLLQAEGWEGAATTCINLFGLKEMLLCLLAWEDRPGLWTLQPRPRLPLDTRICVHLQQLKLSSTLLPSK